MLCLQAVERNRLPDEAPHEPSKQLARSCGFRALGSGPSLLVEGSEVWAPVVDVVYYKRVVMALEGSDLGAHITNKYP